jgi:hypothetical protein
MPLESRHRKLFEKYQDRLNPTSGAKSTRSGKNGENKLKCWKFANNGYPHTIFAQNLPSPHQADPKSKYLFEDGKFIYDLVFLVRGEHL